MRFDTLNKIWKIKDVRNGIIFIVLMLLLYRLLAHIPIPGIHAENLSLFFQSNQFLGLLSLFSGGAIENFSIVSLGVAPYITASIIFQLLPMVVPQIEELQKEGEQGRQKINKWTRYATVPLAGLQAFGIVTLLKQSAQGVLGDLTIFNWVTIIVVMTAGTVFLMWIGELISEKKMGNGISLMIFANIVAGLPVSFQQGLATFERSQALIIILFAILALVMVVSVVIMNEAQRNIPVSYAKLVRGSRLFGGSKSHLPLRVNMAGVIPIIFAISLILFPPLIAQFFAQAKTAWVASVVQWVLVTFQNQWVYGILYFLLVFGFTYFYTQIIFKPDEVAENLQKQGGFIPGIRPGQSTVQYLSTIVSRITFFGALFLGTVSVLPFALQGFTPNQAIIIEGTSLLIVVAVVIEVVKQVQAQIQMYDYENVT